MAQAPGCLPEPLSLEPLMRVDETKPDHVQPADLGERETMLLHFFYQAIGDVGKEYLDPPPAAVWAIPDLR
jgi:hypothetical protein